MKLVYWEGTSREILRGFPEAVRRDLGTGLMYLQMGELPANSKPFNTGIPGGWELRARDSSGQYRVLYICVIRDQVHVLHCFKKSTQKTSRIDIEVAQARFRALKQRIHHEES